MDPESRYYEAHTLDLPAWRVRAPSRSAQAPDLVPVVSKPVSRTVDLPGELQPFLSVTVHAKVAGYVERVLVDRGSVVKQGDLLAELTAPEMKAQIAEAESKVQAAESDACRPRRNSPPPRAPTTV